MPSEESHWIAQPSILMQAADALLRSTVPTATRSGTMAIISLQVLVVLKPQQETFWQWRGGNVQSIRGRDSLIHRCKSVCASA